MAKKSMIAKNKRPAKFSTQAYTRCERCGRPHSVYRKFKLAVFASVNWHTKVKSQVSQKHLGKFYDTRA